MKNETTCPTLGAIIRAQRTALGFTQEVVAAAVGWAAAEMVSLVESGRRSPNLDRIPAIARKLELDAAELCLVALAESYPILYRTIFPPTDSLTPSLHRNLQGASEIGLLGPV